MAGMNSHQSLPTIWSLTCILLLTTAAQFWNSYAVQFSWIQRKGLQLVDESGRPFLLNGANVYWMMTRAADQSGRTDVLTVLQEAKQLQLNVVRAWAFNDGADSYNALQTEPGVFNERVFQALDYVIAQAGKLGIRLMLSLVNNWTHYGGRAQYVKWAQERGQYISDTDGAFFTDDTIKGYFKNYVQVVLNRKNTVTGVLYKDDPTIFAWELMNEPRLNSDHSGDIIADWIQEMARYVKSIDNRHLLTNGLEGFYGPSTPDRLKDNPYSNYGQGTDWIRQSAFPEIDFLSVHSYPDLWLQNNNQADRVQFLQSWVNTHIDAAQEVLQKPVLFSEFGKSTHETNYQEWERYDFFSTMYNCVYYSISKRGAAAGSILWQLLPSTLKSWDDGFAVYITDWSTTSVISAQSQRLASVSNSFKLPTR